MSDKTPVEIIGELEAQLDAERASAVELQAVIEDLQAKLCKAGQTEIDLNAAIEEQRKQLDEAAAQIEALNAEGEELRGELGAVKIRCEEAEKKLENPAFADVAGTKVEIDDEEIEPAVKVDHAKALAEIDDPLKAAQYYAAHKAEIQEQLRK